MNYYQKKWEERKRFLKSTCIISTIITIVIFVATLFCSAGFETIWEIVFIPIMFLGMDVVFTAYVAVFRMVFGKSNIGRGIGANMLRSFWTLIVSSCFYSIPGMCLGLLLMVVFCFLLMICGVWYAIYLPITTIYYYLQARKERTEGDSLVAETI